MRPVPTPPARETPPAWLPVAPAVFLLLWSAGFSVAKIGLEDAEPLTFLSLRYLLVLIVLAPALLFVRPAWPKGWTAWRAVLITGVLIQGAYFGFSYIGFSLGVSAGALALIVSLQPILVGLAAPRVTGEPVTRLTWAGLILGLAGAAMVILAKSQVEATVAMGLAAAVAALFAITVGTLFEKRAGQGGHPLATNIIQYAAGLAAVAPLALLLETNAIAWTPSLIGALAYLSLGNSLVAITLLLAMIRHGAVTKVSALFFLVPPMAAVIAWIALGEAMPPLGWVGLGLAAIGVALATRPARPPAPAK